MDPKWFKNPRNTNGKAVGNLLANGRFPCEINWPKIIWKMLWDVVTCDVLVGAFFEVLALDFTVGTFLGKFLTSATIRLTLRFQNWQKKMGWTWLNHVEPNKTYKKHETNNRNSPGRLQWAASVGSVPRLWSSLDSIFLDVNGTAICYDIYILIYIFCISHIYIESYIYIILYNII